MWSIKFMKNFILNVDSAYLIIQQNVCQNFFKNFGQPLKFWNTLQTNLDIIIGYVYL